MCLYSVIASCKKENVFHKLPQFGNFLTKNTSLIKKFKVKYFHGCMASSKYFTLNIAISPAIIYARYCCHGGAMNHSNHTYSYSVPYTIWLLCKVRSSLAILSVHSYSFINQRLFSSACTRRPGYVRQVRTQLVAVVYIVSYHALLLIDMHRNHTRTSLKYIPDSVIASRKKEKFVS